MEGATTRRRWRIAATLAVATGLIVGTGSSAFATTSWGSWVTIWGPQTPSGGFYPECYRIRPGIETSGSTPVSDFGMEAQYSSGGTCNNALSRPAGYFAWHPALMRYNGSGWVICQDGGWNYNYAGQSGIDGSVGDYAHSCPTSTYQYKGVVQGNNQVGGGLWAYGSGSNYEWSGAYSW